MPYILVGLISFFIGYAMCFRFFQKDITQKKPMVFRGQVYIAEKKS
jgi:hypothetical protein